MPLVGSTRMSTLFVFRHAAAEPRHEGADDAARPLTREGRRKFHDAVLGLDRIDVRFDRVVHSPWVRAAETAELLEPLVDGPIVATERLAAPVDVALLEELGGEHVAVVGHEPWLGELVALLLHGAPDQGHAYRFRKGGAAWLDGHLAPGGMHMLGFLPPKVLRRVR